MNATGIKKLAGNLPSSGECGDGGVRIPFLELNPGEGVGGAGESAVPPAN